MRGKIFEKLRLFDGLMGVGCNPKATGRTVKNIRKNKEFSFPGKWTLEFHNSAHLHL